MVGMAGLAAAAALTFVLLYVVLPSGWLLSKLLGFLAGEIRCPRVHFQHLDVPTPAA